MSSAVTFPVRNYSLTEAAILSNPHLSTATWPDVLARPEIDTEIEEPSSTRLPKVVIRKAASEVTVEIISISPLAPAFRKSVRRVAELLILPEGWNSYKARPIDVGSASRTISLLAELIGQDTPPPSVVPRVRGGIQLEWHTKGCDIEVYIDSPEMVSFTAEDIPSGESIELPLAGNEGVLASWVQRISGK